jgi:hypothetical protein
MSPGFRDNAALRRRMGATYRSVNTSFTTTGLATLATPATGLYLRVYKVLLQAYVTTVLSGATVGDPLVVVDNVIANVVGIGRIAGATAATRAGQGGAVIAANDAITVHYGFWDIDYGDGGLRLAAANNVLKFGAANTIGTGVIAVVGMVLAADEPANPA